MSEGKGRVPDVLAGTRQPPERGCFLRQMADGPLFRQAGGIPAGQESGGR